MDFIDVNAPRWGFSAQFLADPPDPFTVQWPPTPADVREGDEVDVTGVLVKMAHRWLPKEDHRVWRLTGNFINGLYEGVWPD